jgi:8-oxo-dGTP diphosphatase
MPDGFTGAKLALFLGPRLLVYRRDDRPGLPWRGRWDLPGGGRERGESPLACVRRETYEEFGLILPPRALRYARRSPGRAGPVWFFAARLPAAWAGRIRFGDEGQFWRLVHLGTFLTAPDAIPMLQARVRHALRAGF